MWDVDVLKLGTEVGWSVSFYEMGAYIAEVVGLCKDGVTQELR